MHAERSKMLDIVAVAEVRMFVAVRNLSPIQ